MSEPQSSAACTCTAPGIPCPIRASAAQGESPTLRTELVRLFYEQAPTGLIANTAVAAMVAALLWGAVPPALMAGWLIAHAVINAGRYFLLRAWRRATPAARGRRVWGDAAIAGCSLSGLAWASSVTLMTNSGTLAQQLFVTFALAGVSAGALSTMASLRAGYYAFLLPALLPTAIWFLANAGTLYTAMGMLTLLYMGVLLLTATHMRDSIARAVSLSLSNAELARHLVNTHDEALRSNDRLRASEAHLRAIVDTEPECVKLLAHDGTVLEMNAAGLAMLDAERPGEVIGTSAMRFIVAEYVAGFHHYVRDVLRGNPGSFEFELVGLKGTRRWAETTMRPLHEGGQIRLLGITRDITGRKQAELLLHAQNDTLRRIAEDRPLDETLHSLCLQLEKLVPGAIATVLLAHRDGRCLGQAVAPSLPAEVTRALEGLAIGEGSGSCGTAAHRGEAVFVIDTATDPLWATQREFAASQGIRACWSAPFRAQQGGAVTGTVALSHREPKSPAPREREILDTAARLAAIAVDRHRASAALHEATERALVTLYSIGDAVITTDVDGHVRSLNPAAEELTGWSETQSQGRALGEVLNLLDETSREPDRATLARCLTRGEGILPEHESLLRRRDGVEFAVRVSAAPIRDRDGHTLGAVIVLHDMTETRRLTRELSWQANHDALTGLPNRRVFESRLARAVASAREAADAPSLARGPRLDPIGDNRHNHALLYLDLDQFKVINDTAGHQAGDALLREITALLRRRLRGGDLLARLGGDEFGVLLEDCPLDEARRIAADLCQAVAAHRFTWTSKIFPTSASIGVALIDAATPTAESALTAADLACYAAKDLGRNRVHVHHEQDRDLARRHGEMQWVERINRALQDDRLVLYGQTIAPVSVTGAAPHVEMLVRMRDENGALIPPGAFLPAAERYNLMSALDRWVLNRALAWVAERRRAEPQGGPMVCAVNISGTSLADEQMLDYVLDQLRLHDVPAPWLCFEITETAAVSSFDLAHRFITALRAQGCRFALDDFGSGLCSFGYLKDLPVDYVKIDGRFVRDIADDVNARAIVAAIHQIGRALGLATVAEFVENDATLARLREIGVDYAQGYGIAHPEPLAGTGTSATRYAG
jgi:diguanylate cyclase (GGDEF)-like protein/PAS domain S-box-containing protein